MVSSISHNAFYLIANGTLGEAGPKPISIQVDNCNDQYCEVRRGESSAIKLKFRTVTQAIKLKASLKAQIAGFWIGWSLGKQSNVCKFLENASCPVPANTEAVYSMDFTIPSQAPVGTNTVVKLEIESQDGQLLSCVQFPVVVVA